MRSELPNEKFGMMPILRTVQSVRGLSREEARRRYPVNLQGVVTYFDPVRRVFFLNDHTGGIYVDARTGSLDLQNGDEILLSGVSDPGGFSPMIVRPDVEVIGPGRLPSPRDVPLGRVFSGAEDSQWLVVDGVVETVDDSRLNLVLGLASGDERFTAVILGASEEGAGRSWKGSHVRLVGVCGIKANLKRQAAAMVMNVPGMNHVRFIQEVPENPFDIEEVRLGQVLQFEANKEVTHLVRVRGVVTYVGSSGLTALQQGDDGMLIQFATNAIPVVGRRIELVGLPKNSGNGPTVAGPKWRSLGRVDLPPPVLTQPGAVLNDTLQGRLVTVQGVVIQNHSDSAMPSLTLSEQGTAFSADVSQRKDLSFLSGIEEGTLIRLSGVCNIQRDEWRTPVSFRLLVPPSSALEILKEPSWITMGHVIGATMVLGIGVVGSLAWVMTLRFRVSQQTKKLEHEFNQRSELNARYGQLFENASDLIFTLDEEDCFVSLNQAAVSVFKGGRQELIGKGLKTFVDKDSAQRWIISRHQLTMGAEAVTAELLVESEGDKQRLLEATVRLHHRGGGKGIEFQCIARDATERRELEAEIRQLQKLESVGQLAAGVAHDYNNLMTIVIGNAEVLMDDLEGHSESEPLLTDIHSAANKAAGLTKQLLAFSRKQVMLKKVFSSDNLVESMSEMFRRLIGTQVDLKIKNGESLPLIHADQGMIEQVLLNLCINARDAMPEGGTLTIESERLTVGVDHASRVPEALPGEYLCLRVSDTGVGIEEVAQGKVFEPFYTTKEVGKGTGLGLSTVFGILKQHSGWVDLESEPGKGSCFSVYIPVSKLSESKDAAPALVDRPISGWERILVVEDDPDVRRIIVQGLTKAGFKVLVAEDGQSALRVWDSEKQKIDLVVTDMMMPGGISGRDLATRFRKDRPEMKMIYCTGYSTELIGLEEGVSDKILKKPFERDALGAMIRSLLDAV